MKKSARPDSAARPDLENRAAPTERIEAIVFDLYGTLLRIGQRSIHREIPRLMGVDRRRWAELLRSRLLTTRFDDRTAFVQFLCAMLAPNASVGTLKACEESVAREVLSVEPFAGVPSVLNFWKRRGYKLGLISNLSSPHTEPLATLGLAKLFDAVFLSCDEGLGKPDPEAYRRLCSRLGVALASVLMIGDSPSNDVEAPARLGMRTAGIGSGGRGRRLSEVAELDWTSIGQDGTLEPLLEVGQSLRLGERTYRLESVSPLAEALQGRYNLVLEIEASDERGERVRLFAKRFLLPTTAYVEQFAYEMQRATGLQGCETTVLAGLEPLLLLSAAPGDKYSGEMDAQIAYELGKHFVFAFLFSNADIRPRNAFVWRSAESSRIALLDMEHCFFDLALDTDGLEDPLRPETFDRMGQDQLSGRVRKRVLTQRATGRARRSFFGDVGRDTEVGRAFRDGFIDFYRRQGQQADSLCEKISCRLSQEPPLIIGTQSYRRAMASIDLEEIRRRLARDPEEAFEWCY